jgi:hypothetical protein
MSREALSRLARRATASITFALGLSLSIPAAHAVPLLNGFGGPSGFGEAFLPANDDGSTSELALPFPIAFYGKTYNSLWINNNGNVTFTDRLGSYTPNAFPGTQPPMLAPWWADVDTRGTGSDIVYFAAPNANSFVVTWPNVGYYSNHVDKLNSFQLVIQRNPGDTSGAFTAEYRYESLQWTTGDFSGGTNGLGGTAAVAGYDAGDNVNYFMLPGSRTNSILEAQNTSNVDPSTPGLWRFFFGSNGQAPGSSPSNPLLPVTVDDSFAFQFPVQPSIPVFIDPPVAIGYDYTVTGGPLFTSVTAPTLPADNLFDLYFSADSCATYTSFVAQLTGGVAYSFPTAQSCFGIRDIAMSANLDPSDPLAFVTGITFNQAGFVTVTQTPISADVPGPLPLLGAAAAFRSTRRLRKRVMAVRSVF